MLVEFIGVPGSGKTTLAAAVVKRLRERGIDARLRFRDFDGPWAQLHKHATRTAFLARHALARPGSVPAAVRLVRASRQPSAATVARLTQSLLYLESLCAVEEPRCDTLVLHQGFCQLLYSLAFSSTADPQEILALTYPAVRKADVYVKVSAPTETIAARLHGRSRAGSRLQHRLDEGTAVLDASAALIDGLCALIEADGRTLHEYVYAPRHELDEVARALAADIVSG